MKKYMELFCNQNPNFEIECQNPNCPNGGKHIFKSKDVFKSNSFCFKCEEQDILFDSKHFADSFKEELLKTGIRW